MCVLLQGLGRLRQFLGRALWLGQARGTSAVARSSNVFIISGLGWVKTKDNIYRYAGR